MPYVVMASGGTEDLGDTYTISGEWEFSNDQVTVLQTWEGFTDEDI